MKRTLLFLVCLVLLPILDISTVCGQTAQDPNAGIKLEWDATNSIFRYKWWAKSGSTYFIQHSEDLQTWTWVPVVEPGTDSIKEWGFTSSGNKFFLRLRYTDIAVSDPENGDFDSDGVTNLAEVQQGTDPFHNADSDNDGLSDDAEIALGFNPNDAFSQDPGHAKKDGDVDKDGSGIPNSWMVQYFNADASKWPSSDADGDLDGMSNLDEFNASFFDSETHKWVGPNPTKLNTDNDAEPDGADGWATQPELSPARLPVTHYAVVPIPDSEAGTPLYVNDKGHVVYRDQNGSFYFWDGTTTLIQKSSQASTVDSIGGFNNNDVVAINQVFARDVFGQEYNANNPNYNSGNNANRGVALWTKAGGAADLNGPPNILTYYAQPVQRTCRATGINDSNEVFGSTFEKLNNGGPYWYSSAAVVWNPEGVIVGDVIKFTDNPYHGVETGGNEYSLYSINNSGKIVGGFTSYLSQSPFSMGSTIFLDNPSGGGGAYWTGSLHPMNDVATSINDLGHMVITGGFLLNDSQKALLPNAPTGYVNNRMQSLDSTGQKLWQNNKWFDLSALVSDQWSINAKQISHGTGIILTAGTKVKNDDGTTVSPFGQPQSVMLLPIEVKWEAKGDWNNVDDNKSPVDFVWFFPDEVGVNGNATDGRWLPGRGKRIFPDKASPTGELRNRVRLKIKTTSIRSDKKVFVKVFDVDDPTPTNFAGAVVDPNGDAGADNYGSDADHEGHFTFISGGAVSNPSTGDSADGVQEWAGCEVTLDSNGEAYAELELTSMQPGDNFRAVVALRQDDLNGLQVTSTVTEKYIYPSSQTITGFNGVASEMLTVWRKLHVEIDSMATVPDPRPSPDQSTYFAYAYDAETITLGGPSILPNGFYAHGFLKHGSLQAEILSDTHFSGGPGGTTHVLTVSGLSEAQKASLMNETVTLIDDDMRGLPAGFDPILPQYNLINDQVIARYVTSYILVANANEEGLNPANNRQVPFEDNAEPIPILSSMNGARNLHDTPEFWSHLIIAAYQPAIDDDNDPEDEIPNQGLTWPFNEKFSAIYIEAIRDDYTFGLTNSTQSIREGAIKKFKGYLYGVVAHEIGHGPSSVFHDDHAEGGLISEANDITERNFTAKTVRRFRQAISWGTPP